MSRLNILIAAGGTGGHIYPALAIADSFKKSRPDVRIEFVGSVDGLENKVIPAKGYPLHRLNIGRLNSNVSPFERIKTLLLMPLAFIQSWNILRKYKPDLVLGVGGHASGPLLLMAALFGYRSAIWEPNAMPGLANRWLSKFVDDCWVVFNEAKPYLKNSNLHQAGMPIRDEIEEMPVKAGGTHRDFSVLVFGGSQGARGINNAVLAMLKGGGLDGVHFVHQTGSTDFARIRDEYGALAQSGQVDVREYLHNMGEQYAQADLVICRSGTGTLSELAACGKPAILIPLPTAADDHQRKNAESLGQKGAAVIILQKDLTGDSLREAILNLKNNPGRLKEMSQLVRGFHHPHAADHLVVQFIERIEPHASR